MLCRVVWKIILCRLFIWTGLCDNGETIRCSCGYAQLLSLNQTVYLEHSRPEPSNLHRTANASAGTKSTCSNT